MSVYIEGMEMPTRCCECRLSTCHSFKERPLCDVLVEYMSYGEWEAKRLDNCPLVTIPPHGDLIDRDAAAEKIWDDMRFPSNLANAQFFVNELREMPTIIPADEPKEET